MHATAESRPHQMHWGNTSFGPGIKARVVETAVSVEHAQHSYARVS